MKVAKVSRHPKGSQSGAVTAAFMAPMLLLKVEKLPDDRKLWEYQLKLDGFRSIAFKSGGRVYLRSRNDKDFASAYPTMSKRSLAFLTRQ